MQREEIGTKEDLDKYRLDTAKTDLKSAKLLLENEDYKGASVLCNIPCCFCGPCFGWKII